jgi:hypothetical protein
MIRNEENEENEVGERRHESLDTTATLISNRSSNRSGQTNGNRQNNRNVQIFLGKKKVLGDIQEEEKINIQEDVPKAGKAGKAEKAEK